MLDRDFFLYIQQMEVYMYIGRDMEKLAMYGLGSGNVFVLDYIFVYLR